VLDLAESARARFTFLKNFTRSPVVTKHNDRVQAFKWFVTYYLTGTSLAFAEYNFFFPDYKSFSAESPLVSETAIVCG
jgi:hypothetical protein